VFNGKRMKICRFKSMLTSETVQRQIQALKKLFRMPPLSLFKLRVLRIIGAGQTHADDILGSIHGIAVSDRRSAP
jgi:hypothetical protein